jgi:hypothetical protein
MSAQRDERNVALAANRYVDRRAGIEPIKLLPGESFIANRDGGLVTAFTGEYRRKVYFLPKTRRIRRLRKVSNDTMLRCKRNYRRQSRARRVDGEAELFS